MKISADIIEKDVRRDEGSTGELLIKLKPKHRNYVLPFPDTSSTNCNWNSVKHQVMKRCGLSPESQVSICYIDEENDKVHLDSDAEFHEAIRVGHKCGKKLKIVVKDIGSDGQNIVQHSSGETFSYRELESGEFVVMDKLPCIQTECEPVNDQSIKQKASLAKEIDAVNDAEESSVQLKDDLVKEISEKVFERVMRTLGNINLNSLPEAEQKPVFAQKTERNNSMLHVGVICDHCRTPIHGIGYKCGKCPDYDLCEQCERMPYVHNEDHFFLKIRHNTGIYNQVHGLCASMENTSTKYSPSRRTSHAVKATVIRNSVGLKNRKEEKIKKVMRKIEKYRYPSRDAEFIKDETIPNRTITPGLKFQKSWRMRNTGSKPFTSDTILKHSWGGEKLKSESTEFPVPPLLPGQEGTVSISFTAPPEIGSYLSHWRLSHKGVGFGGRAWCVIEVEKLQEQSSKESADEINEKCTVEQNNVQEGITQVLTAVQEEQQRGDGMARKVAILSHTATPTNTPFDLSPPKSPEPPLTETPNCIKETKVSNVKEDDATICLEMQSAQAENYTTGSESDDTISVINLNSSESDTEFVIVPMPLCCNMDIPLVPSSLQQDEQRTNTVGLSETCSAPSTRRASVEQLASPSSLPSICVCGSKESNASESSYSCSSPASERAETPENTLCSANVEGQNLIQLDQILPTIDNQKEEIPISPSVEAQNAAVQGDSGSTVRETEPPCQNDNGTAEASNIRNENTDNEERMVQVLPEGLVNGALTAAASVYNTARAVITGMQNRNEPLHEDWRQSQTYAPPLPPSPMQQLFEMGFCNRALNHHLLVKHKGRVEDVVTELVANHDNDWYAHRHSTNPYLVNFD